MDGDWRRATNTLKTGENRTSIHTLYQNSDTDSGGETTRTTRNKNGGQNNIQRKKGTGKMVGGQKPDKGGKPATLEPKENPKKVQTST